MYSFLGKTVKPGIRGSLDDDSYDMDVGHDYVMCEDVGKDEAQENSRIEVDEEDIKMQIADALESDEHMTEKTEPDTRDKQGFKNLLRGYLHDPSWPRSGIEICHCMGFNKGPNNY